MSEFVVRFANIIFTLSFFNPQTLINMNKRSVLHMDLDTFFVSVERLQNNALKGKPILVGGSSDRGVVAACSYEARTFGIHSAMPMRMARMLCPEAIIIRGDSSNYSKYSRMVTEIMQESLPVLEKSSIDEFYADLTGMDRFFGCYSMASELRQRIMNETGLPISFGLSENKTVSKIATGEAKPNNQIKIDYGNEMQFLAPLSVKKIPMVGEKAHKSLSSLGVRKISTLQKMPCELIEKAFGKNGVTIWKKARGIDTTPVVPYSEKKSISTERTFDKDTTDTHRLQSILLGMTEELAFQLRTDKRLTACVTVKIRYSDFNTHTLQSRISYTSADHILLEKVKELFKRLYNKRLLVRLIGIRFSALVGGGYQINLFDDTEEMIRLYQAMDSVRNRFGKQVVMRAQGMDVRNRRYLNAFNKDQVRN